MSSKKSSDQIVQSRRLRPIYDAIDNGQNKKAIQEADKVLKKHPKTPTAKALKALAFVRTDKTSEAWSLIDSVEMEIKAGIFDENLLQALCHCYKELYMPERIVSLYELLTNKCPGDETLLCQLFLAYVRVRNYKQQQKVAMQLYKEFNLTPYLMWSIMSIVMQGAENEKLGNTMFYPLAEKMMEKVIETHAFKGEEVDLYLSVLEARGKVKKAIDYLQAQPTIQLETVPGTRAARSLDRLYFLDGDFNAVVAKSADRLEDDFNDWTSWTYLMDSAFAIFRECEDSLNERVLFVVDVCLNALKRADDQSERLSPRSPLMACLEMISRLKAENYFSNEDLKSSISFESALTYMRRLVGCSHMKTYCFIDLKMYLHLLDKAETMELLSHIDQQLLAGKTAESEELVWTNVLKEQIIAYASILNAKEMSNDAETMDRVKHLIGSLPLDASASVQHGSTLSGLITNYLWEMNDGEVNWTNAYSLMIILEYVRQRYIGSDANVTFLLCRLAALFGDVGRVRELCKQMDVKYIQRDSLGYLQFFLTERFGQLKSSILYYTSLSAQFDQNEREVSECCVNAYKNGQFLHIVKFENFHQRCVNSIFWTASDVMNRALSSCFAIDSCELAGEALLGDSLRIDWENICDNRDFDMITSMVSECCLPEKIEAVKEKSFQEIVSFSKLQHALCLSVGILSQKTVTLESFDLEFKEFVKQLEVCEKEFGVNDESRSFLYFSHCRLLNLLRGGFLKIPLFTLTVTRLLLERRFDCVQSNDGKERKDSENNGDEMKLSETEVLELVDKLPPVEKLSTVLKAIDIKKVAPEDQTNAISLVKILEQYAFFVQYSVLSLLALKFLENLLISYKWLKRSEKTLLLQQAALSTTPVAGKAAFQKKENPLHCHLTKYQFQIVNVLSDIRSSATDILAALNTSNGVKNTNFEASDESLGILKMPKSNELLLDELLKAANATLQFEENKNSDKQTVEEVKPAVGDGGAESELNNKVNSASAFSAILSFPLSEIADLKKIQCAMEISLRASYIQSVEELLSTLQHADEKLLNNVIGDCGSVVAE